MGPAARGWNSANVSFNGADGTPHLVVEDAIQRTRQPDKPTARHQDKARPIGKSPRREDGGGPTKRLGPERTSRQRGQRFGYPAPTGPRPANAVVTFRSNYRLAMGNDPLTRQFALESQTRAIDHCTDIDELRSLAKRLLSAWYMQSDMTRAYGAQALGMERLP